MSFFYDLNKKLDSIRATPEVTHQQLNERNMSQHAKGIKKYTKPGMEELSRLGREGASEKKMDAARKEYNQYDNEEVTEGGEVIDGVYKLSIEPKRPEELENKMTRGTRPRSDKSNQIFPSMRLPSDEKFPPMRLPKGDERVFPPMRLPTDEGLAGAGKKIYELGKRAASGINKMIGHGSDEELLGTLRKDMGVVHPTGSKRPTPPGMQSTGDTPRDIFLKGETSSERAARLGDPRVKNANDEGVKEAGKKLNFADKIANAKKEVDEMLGDVAAEAMRSALSPKQKKMAALGGDPKRIDARDLEALRKGADMGEERSKGTAFDMSTKRVDKPKVGSIERGAKHDIKHTATGRMVTRRTDAQGNSVGADDDSDTQAGPRGRGRPKGTKGAIGAKGPSGKSKLMTKEGDQDITDQGEYDQEGDMAKDVLKTIMRHAQDLNQVLGDNDNLPEWVQSKLAKIESMMISVDEYMQNQEDDEQEPIAEKAVSKQQQKFMGMAHAMQKGEKVKGASKELKKVASTMKPKDTEDFAKTKHKGLPEKKKKEVDETSEEGRITTTRTGPGKTLTTSSTGRVSATIGNGKMSVKPGKQDKPMDDDTDTASSSTKDTSKPNSMVGKGIYDSMNRELELMIAESMSINMSDSTEGNKSLTVTATDEDAMRLAVMLKSAGLGGQGRDLQSDESCSTCGMPDCGCGDVHEAVDENAPDYPTNTEQADNNFGYSGGLNKPKTDVAGAGQTTVPNTNVHTQEEDALRRMMEMAGLAEAAKPDFLDMDKDGDKEESMKDAVKDKDEDSVDESIQRMREMAGIKEAKKDVEEEKTEEGNLFTGNLAKARADGKKQADLDGDGDMEKVRESIFSLNNQWKAYKG